MKSEPSGRARVSNFTQTTPAHSHDLDRGFTMLELLVTLFTIGLLVFCLIPALARSNPAGKAARCQQNLRQLTRAWSMYSADSGDRVPNNFGVSETVMSIDMYTFQNWANNVMTWAISSTADISNTNVLWAKRGPLGSYLGQTTVVYHCPSDAYVSPVQRAVGWPERVRSFSMNAVFGRFSSGTDTTASGLNWGFPQYMQYLKQTQVPKPAGTWLLVEEHPDSINDGYFLNNPSVWNWGDIPSSLHNGGCSFSFVDGHTEVKRWQSTTSWYPVQYSYPTTRSFDALGREDYSWYLARTGWVDAKTGQRMFGY